jgi:hypothetical protein
MMQDVWYISQSKEVFVFVSEGKLLGHIVRMEGVYIDPERIKPLMI